MPSKIYGIITDKKYIVVGTGGKSGRNPKPRSGHHLPGGTVEEGQQPELQLITEIKEETGLDVAVHVKDSFKPEGLDNVSFNVITVESVPDLVKERKRPEVKNQRDEPFEEVSPVLIGEALVKGYFNAKDMTDWFEIGLQYAFETGRLK
ncbi:MAG TPA: NUDIX domain-containing protein [Steroidobacteraceae bacterium]|nr:NUDIX domain-containing protein [Steroidobacteraceae bacterium]